MFTGIIEAKGHIEATVPSGEDMRVHIATGKLDLADVKLGDSIAVNGVCLTAVELPGKSFWADISAETLAHTTFKSLSIGTVVNLEKALTPTTRLGGHLVSGHVDGVGEIVSRSIVGNSEQFKIKAPDSLAKYIAKKGSICVEGISLTVNEINGAVFDLNIVPHTLGETSLQKLASGSKVNLEVDLIARYLERLVLGDKAADTTADTGNINLEFLTQHGFMK